MADLQSTNRTKLSRARESTYGTMPTTPAFKQVRQTSSGLNANPQTIQSNEIRTDRQITDLILVGLNAQGPIGGELSFYAHDDDLEEALQGTWSNLPSLVNVTADTEISDVSATTITVVTANGSNYKTGHLVLSTGFTTSANNKVSRVSSNSATTVVFPALSFTAEAAPPVGATIRVIGFQGATADIVATITLGNALTSTLLDFTTLGLTVGCWVKIGQASVSGSGFAATANNGWCRVSAIAASRLSFSIVPASWGADAGTGKTISVFMGDFLINASTKRSVTFERQYQEQSPTSYEYFKGQMLNTLDIAMEAKTIVTLTKNFLGSDAQLGNVADNSAPTTRIAGSTDVAAPTYDVMNTTAHFAQIMVGGEIVSGPNFIMSASFNINNNLRNQNAMGELGAVGIGNGEFSVTGSMRTYFGDTSVYQDVLSNAETSFTCIVGGTDTTLPMYTIDCPAIKYSAGAPTVEGKNADVMLDGSYQGIMHETLGYTMSIGRFWSVPV